MSDQFQIVGDEIKYAIDDFNLYTIPKYIKGLRNGTEYDFVFINVTIKEFSVDFQENSELTYIGSFSFAFKSNLKSIKLENAKRLTIIHSSAFKNCTSLTSITFPSSLKELAYWGIFEFCISLKNVTFPKDSALEIIGLGTFQSTGLTTFHIPSKCSYLKGESFGWSNIVEFTVDKDNKYFQVYNKSLFSYDFKTLIFQAQSSEMQLHENTTNIGYCAFKGYKYDLTFPNKTLTFEKAPFYGYQGSVLTFNCPISTTTQRMFENCQCIKRIYFNNELGIITDSVFNRTNTLRCIYLAYPINEISTKDFNVLNKVCFSGCIESVKKALPLHSIKDCFNLVQTCSKVLPKHYSYIFTLIFIAV